MQPTLSAVRAPRLQVIRGLVARLHAQLRGRSVYRTAAAYAVAAAGTIQLGDVLRNSLNLPGQTTLVLFVGSLAGFPVVIAASWLFEVRRDRARALRPTGDEPDPAPQPSLPASYVDNLLPQPTPFVGRERELTALLARLEEPGGRLVTILGAGGMGKTRLALEAAARALSGFANGVCVVPLAGVRSVELIAPAIATALRLSPAGGVNPLAPVLDFLREKRLLLLFDNFEHLTEGAELVGRLLAAAPGVRALVTSRERLGLPGELLFPLHGMMVDGEGEDGGDAVALFLEGARRVRPAFAPDADELASIVRICRGVEGHPLAIELASPWVRLLPCREIEAEIAESQDFLAASHPGLPPRHRSLRAAFEWSWRHLGPDEQGAMRRLAVFRGGFTRAAAAQVARAGLPMLSALADKSLVRVAEAGRYEMLDVLRACAQDELARDTAEQGEARRRHADFYAGLMREVSREHRERPGEHALRDGVAADLRNLRAAAEWAARSDLAAFEELLRGLFVFYDGQGRAVEGEEGFAAAVAWLEEVRAQAPGEDADVDRLLGVAMIRYGVFLAQVGRVQQAVGRLRAGLERAREHGDRDETALALQELAGQAYFAGDYDEAVRLQDEALALWRALGDSRGTGRGLTTLGNVAVARGDYPLARRLYGEAVEMLRAAGDRGRLFAPLCNLGVIASLEHDWDAARRLLGESLAAAREAGNARLVANALQNLGGAAWEAGDYAAAEAHLEEAVALCHDLGLRRLLAFCQNLLGNVFTARGELRRAGEAAAAALAIAVEIGEAPLTLLVLVGFARLRRAEGRYAEAAELAALLLTHPAADQPIRTAGTTLRDELAAALPAAELRAAEARGRDADLAATAARLREP
ncbi:MAG: ATP-binding protein [Longimicrobiaceae bacterium]